MKHDNNNYLQWNPLNVITFGQRESDNIGQMITISDCLLILTINFLDITNLANLGQLDHINQMILLSE
jgi:hypothetical protein